MEQEMKIEVKIISKETLKPSLPPPSHPKTLTLSLPDQFYGAFHVPVLLYYTTTSKIPECGFDISSLRNSLSQTLNQFYPLAGRLLDHSTINCNHQGIPFIETKVNADLSVFLNSPHRLKLLSKFLPPSELRSTSNIGTQPISELVPLAFQINVFLCGGVVIGCYMLHKLLDAASLGTFFKYWSALTSKRFEDLVQPDFEANIKVFPPIPADQRKHVLFPRVPPTGTNSFKTVLKSFKFDAVTVSKLQARAASELLPKPTRFEAVAGFLWEQTLAAARNLGAQVEHTKLSVVVNMRPRMCPPLPKGSMGNVITKAYAQVDDKNSSRKLHEFVQEIHSALSDTNHKIGSTMYQGENAAKTFLSDLKAEFQNAQEHQEGIFWLTSWCSLGLNEADFGFGKPIWIVPTDGTQPPPILRNLIFLTDYCHSISGDGIEAWFLLEEKVMQMLGSNPDFIAFASAD